jgi:hypothetical protein
MATTTRQQKTTRGDSEMKWRDGLGMLLLMIGVGGCMSGVRGLSGDAWWGGPAIGAGAIVNVLAYRALRPGYNDTAKEKERGSDESDPPTTSG